MNDIVAHLKQSDIFYQFTQTQLELVGNLCQEKIFNEGEIIFEENSSSKELYVIIQGEVDIIIDPSMVSTKQEKQDMVITTLRRGQSFGEVALVDEGLRSATARARTKNTRLLVIPREKILMLCETYPQLGYRMMYNLAADLAMKIRQTDLIVCEKVLYGQTKSQ